MSTPGNDSPEQSGDNGSSNNPLDQISEEQVVARWKDGSPREKIINGFHVYYSHPGDNTAAYTHHPEIVKASQAENRRAAIDRLVEDDDKYPPY